MMVALKINLSVSTAIGFIVLFGTAVENGVMLVTFFNQLRQEGLSTAEAVRKGCELRLRPLMMTTLTTLLEPFYRNYCQRQLQSLTCAAVEIFMI